MKCPECNIEMEEVWSKTFEVRNTTKYPFNPHVMHPLFMEKLIILYQCPYCKNIKVEEP